MFEGNIFLVYQFYFYSRNCPVLAHTLCHWSCNFHQVLGSPGNISCPRMWPSDPPRSCSLWLGTWKQPPTSSARLLRFETWRRSATWALWHSLPAGGGTLPLSPFLDATVLEEVSSPFTVMLPSIWEAQGPGLDCGVHPPTRTKCPWGPTGNDQRSKWSQTHYYIWWDHL